MRARIAAARGEAVGNTSVPGNGVPGVHRSTAGAPGTACPVIPGVPPEAVAVLIPLLASGRTSAAAARLALGSPSQPRTATCRQCGTAVTPRPPGLGRQQQYVTIGDLAEAVCEGLVDEVDDARQLLEQVHDLIRRQRLTLVKDDGQ